MRRNRHRLRIRAAAVLTTLCASLCIVSLGLNPDPSRRGGIRILRSSNGGNSEGDPSWVSRLSNWLMNPRPPSFLSPSSSTQFGMGKVASEQVESMATDYISQANRNCKNGNHEEETRLLAEAIQQTSAVVAKASRGNGTHPRIADLFQRLFAVKLIHSDPWEAEKAARHCLEYVTRMHGTKLHPCVDEMATIIAKRFVECQRWMPALRFMDISFEIRNATFGGMHPCLAPVLESISQVMAIVGEIPQAIKIAEKCLAIRRQVAPESRETSQSYAILGALWRNQSNAGRASWCYRKCADIRDKVAGPSDPLASESYGILSELSLARAKIAERDGKAWMQLKRLCHAFHYKIRSLRWVGKRGGSDAVMMEGSSSSSTGGGSMKIAANVPPIIPEWLPYAHESGLIPSCSASSNKRRVAYESSAFSPPSSLLSLESSPSSSSSSSIDRLPPAQQRQLDWCRKIVDEEAEVEKDIFQEATTTTTTTTTTATNDNKDGGGGPDSASLRAAINAQLLRQLFALEAYSRRESEAALNPRQPDYLNAERLLRTVTSYLRWVAKAHAGQAVGIKAKLWTEDCGSISTLSPLPRERARDVLQRGLWHIEGIGKYAALDDVEGERVGRVKKQTVQICEARMLEDMAELYRADDMDDEAIVCAGKAVDILEVLKNDLNREMEVLNTTISRSSSDSSTGNSSGKEQSPLMVIASLGASMLGMKGIPTIDDLKVQERRNRLSQEIRETTEEKAIAHMLLAHALKGKGDIDISARNYFAGLMDTMSVFGERHPYTSTALTQLKDAMRQANRKKTSGVGGNKKLNRVLKLVKKDILDSVAPHSSVVSAPGETLRTRVPRLSKSMKRQLIAIAKGRDFERGRRILAALPAALVAGAVIGRTLLSPLLYNGTLPSFSDILHAFPVISQCNQPDCTP